MSGELVAQIDSGAWKRETSIGYDPVLQTVPVGNTYGIGLQKLIQSQLIEYYQYSFTIPTNLTITTGLTFQFRIVDDGQNAADLGLVVRIGVTVFNIDSGGFLVGLTAASGAEQTTNVTLSSTAGAPVSGSIAIANAQLASAGAGNNVLIRMRRIGDNAADTCYGRPVIINAHVKNT
jgi:hypothetical protein